MLETWPQTYNSTSTASTTSSEGKTWQPLTRSKLSRDTWATSRTTFTSQKILTQAKSLCTMSSNYSHLCSTRTPSRTKHLPSDLTSWTSWSSTCQAQFCPGWLSLFLFPSCSTSAKLPTNQCSSQAQAWLRYLTSVQWRAKTFQSSMDSKRVGRWRTSRSLSSPRCLKFWLKGITAIWIVSPEICSVTTRRSANGSQWEIRACMTPGPNHLSRDAQLEEQETCSRNKECTRQMPVVV